ncbi:MAG: DUF4209 domain-containing protein [Bryobacterales bacterium]|nr:DUF4209 domain-containing protein [Bryobacterales bacterium]
MAIVVPQSVLELLERIESGIQPLKAFELGTSLGGKHLADGLSEDERKGAWSEVAAFNFMSMGWEERSVWGTHFGPVFQQIRNDGTSLETPSITDIDGESLDYWKERSKQTPHPVLKSRYADLVWDLHSVVTKQNPEIEFAQRAIDGYLESVNSNLYVDPAIGIRQGQRAIELALRIDGRKRIEESSGALFALHAQLTQAQVGGALVFLFDALYTNKRVPLSEEQQKNIIDLLEVDLARCTKMEDGERFSPWDAKAAGERLVSHYKRIGRQDEVERVVRRYGGAFEAISQEADGLRGMTWLRSTAEDYRRQGMARDAERVQIAGTEKGKQASGEMKELAFSASIDRSELEAYFDAITQGPPRDVLRLIAAHFIPKTSDAEEALNILEKKHPLIALIGVEKISEGHISGQAGPIAEDRNGRLYFKLGESISFRAPLLRGSLAKTFEKHHLTAELILAHLYESPFFDDDKRDLIKHGLEAYCRKDHITAISVLVPQIEQGLRVLLGLLGMAINEPKKDGTMQLKNLNRILHESPVIGVLGEDTTNYFIVLLADSRGWNLRNRLCHGLLGAEDFRQEISDRVLHCLLVLGLRRKPTPSSEQSPAE